MKTVYFKWFDPEDKFTLSGLILKTVYFKWFDPEDSVL